MGFSTVVVCQYSRSTEQSLALPGSQFWALCVTRGTVSRNSTYEVLPPP